MVLRTGSRCLLPWARDERLAREPAPLLWEPEARTDPPHEGTRPHGCWLNPGACPLTVFPHGTGRLPCPWI